MEEVKILERKAARLEEDLDRRRKTESKTEKLRMQAVLLERPGSASSSGVAAGVQSEGPSALRALSLDQERKFQQQLRAAVEQARQSDLNRETAIQRVHSLEEALLAER